MTHPIPGADSERELPPLPQPARRFLSYVVGEGKEDYFSAVQMAAYIRADRAAAKVGANVAAGLSAEFRAVIEEAASVLESAAAHNRSENRTVLAHSQQDRADRLRLGLAAGAPSETPKPVAYGVYGINGRGQTYLHEAKKLHDDWRSDDCGLGERWAGNDALVPAIAAQHAPAPIAGDVEKDAGLRFADEIITAVLTQGADFDGGHLQELALEHGLLRVEDMAGPCGENCACARDGVEFWPSQCYRKTYLAAMLANSSSGEAG